MSCFLQETEKEKVMLKKESEVFASHSLSKSSACQELKEQDPSKQPSIVGDDDVHDDRCDDCVGDDAEMTRKDDP
jgi:hypothetical protein